MSFGAGKASAIVVTLLIGLTLGLGAPPINPVWYELARASASAILTIWAFRTASRHTDPVLVSAALFFTWTLATTAAYGRLSLGMVFSSAAALALLVLARAHARIPGSFRTGLVIVAVGTIILSGLTVVQPGIGLDGNPRYFVGGKNALGMFLLPLALVLYSAWQPRVRFGQVIRWSALIGSGAVTIAGGSATGTVAALATLAWIASGGRLGRRWWPWFVSVPVIHWALVSGWLVASVSWAGELLAVGLGKSADFTRRSFTWDVAWSRVRDNPLGEGRGYTFIDERFSDVAETHNLFLEAMVTGGWPSACFLLLVIAQVMRAASNSTNRAGVFFVWVGCLIGAMESYTFHLTFWLLLGIAASVGQQSADTTSSASTFEPIPETAP